MHEHDIQNAIRIAISERELGSAFRVNVGTAWQGDKVIKQSNGSILIQNARPFNSGLPKGFSDLFIVMPVIITPGMVGQRFARACFIEVKTPSGRLREAQVNFIEQMQRLGAAAGVARSVEDAISICERVGQNVN